MSTRLFFSLFLFLSYSDLISQSFENISLINNNIVPYSLNEANAYLSTDGNTLYFNSSNNSNNIGGLADMNDVWYRNKINNVWGSPINLSVVNTSDNEVIIGLYYGSLIILSNNSISYYDVNDNFKLIKNEALDGFSPNYNLLSGSLNKSLDMIFLSFEGYGTYGVEDIYVSKKNNGEWGRLTNIGSIVNSQYQDLSPFLLDGDTLTFISNRNEVGYELFYTLFNNNSWSDPIKMNILNTSKSEVSLTYDYNSNNFLLSAASDNKTNSDIFFFGNNKAKINITFKLNNTVTNGILYLNSDSVSFNSNVFSLPIENSDIYEFKFIVDNFFIKDTIINVNNSKEISINLDPIESGSRVVLKNLIFKQSSSVLVDESFSYLNNLIHLFNVNSNITITIEGHTDNRGDFKSNIKLSKDRAETIRDFLILNGINKSKIKVKGFGPTKPKFSNESEDSRKLNRRVEIYVN
jgi:flagellar motor protein MotB